MMKAQRLISIIDRTSRGLSTIIDARMLRDQLVDLLDVTIARGEKLGYLEADEGYRAVVAALREMKL